MKYFKLFIPFVVFGLIIYSILLATPEKTYYSKEDNRTTAELLTITIVIILPLILAPLIFPKTLIQHYFGFYFLGMIGYISGNEFRDWNIKKELRLTGHITKGIVKSKRFSKPAKGVGHWEIFCEFEDSTFIYNTFYVEDKDDKFHEGDTLAIRYLKRNPEISEIIFKIEQ